MAPYVVEPRKPKLKLPQGACDCHFHVFGPQAHFPFAKERAYTPEDRPREQLFGLHERLGIERGVVVQSAAHGFDNSASADLIAARPDAYVGVALVPVSATHSDIKKLDRQGFRGARFNYMRHLGAGTPLAEVIRFAEKQLEEMNWHLQIHLERSLIGEMAPALARSPVPVVIDHMGRVDASLGLEQAPFLQLMKLLERPNFYVKVSCCERASREGPPYADAVPFARKLVAEFGDRTLWGTDWPHPNVQPVPDDALLAELLAEIAPSEVQRKALLVDNPQRFYGFQS